MTKILVLNPPNISSQNVVRDGIYGCWCKGKRIGGAQTPPYPLLEIATVLKQLPVPVEVIDAPAEGISIAGLKKIIIQHQIVIILTSVMTFSEDVQALKELKEANKDLKSIVCGSLPTFMPEFCLKNEAVDIIVLREPEFIIRDLVVAMSKGENWQALKGIGYCKNTGLCVNDYYPLIKDLDELPFVDWSLLSKKARYFNPLIKRHPYVTDLTTRGCPEKCTFCMAPGFYGNKVRARSAENVIAGFREHVQKGIKEVYLRDEMFTTFKARNKEIYERLIKENIDLTWLCSSRVDSLDRETMRLMKKSGCHTIKFGVESGVQQLLDNVKKRISIKQTEDAFRWAREAGLNTHAHVMLGLPGETKETIKETLRFIKRIRPTTATFGIVTPYPGTALFEQVARSYPEIKEGFSLDLKTLHTSSFFTHTFCDLTSEELAYYEKKVHRDFYLRPSYIYSRLTRIKSLKELIGAFKAGTKVIDFSIRGDE
ncbi:MAG: radical SAM protein [Candidatus Omnitrophica bacterium]|nr:radical SAM protein [Candidatus Omnitrophota bacterium]